MIKEEQVTIDSTNIEDFRKAYQACEGETFIFKGQEVDKRFAMYFLQNWDKNMSIGDPDAEHLCTVCGADTLDPSGETELCSGCEHFQNRAQEA